MALTLAIQGLRGGAGVTTVVAALGAALQAQGERVLLVEATPDHMLGLHLGLPVAETAGWARSRLDGEPWEAAAFECRPGLVVLPYGRTGADERVRLAADGVDPARRLLAALAPLAGGFDWILVDQPPRPAVPATGEEDGALDLLLAPVDPACHVHLARGGAGSRWVLPTRYDPAIPLQRDLLQLWQGGLRTRLVPLRLHEDSAVPMALACRRPLGDGDAGSLAAADVAGLALWCLARRAERLPEVPA